MWAGTDLSEAKHLAGYARVQHQHCLTVPCSLFIVFPMLVTDVEDGAYLQVVNGFFWGGKPVSSPDPNVTRTTALGVSGYELLISI